jgi:hypothetical protein
MHLSRSQNRKSWRSAWGLVIPVIAALVFSSRAATESDAAGRQATGFATITNCNSGRSTYYCHYNFSVGGEWYQGVSSGDNLLLFGSAEVVYYDSRNPDTNALEDFARKSHDDWLFAGCWIAAVVIYSGFIFLSGPTREPTSFGG